jgi:hypothetical protein
MAFHFVVFRHWQVPTTTANKVEEAVLLFVFAVVSFALGARDLRAGLWIGADRVVVRGMLRSTKLAPEPGFRSGEAHGRAEKCV